ncbi:MAG TPA: FtsX-like permease family protein, partial [Deinococcales bacterium]|nr:FtsX-like permease family protein [Deinococcales bacterium]
SLTLATGRDLGAADVNGAVALAGSKAAQRGNLTLGRDVRFNRANIFKVVGVLKEGGGFTDSIIFVPFNRLATALGIQGKASVIAVKLDDASRARAVQKLIETRFPELRAQTQGDVLAILDKAVSLGDAVRFGISLIALIVGGLAVANTVMMGVYERTREFGVLRAIGAQPVFVFQLVILESFLLAVLGGVIGVGMGYLGTIAVNFAVRNLTSVAVAALTPRLVGLALLIAGALGLLSGLLPARTVGRLQITEALGRN